MMKYSSLQFKVMISANVINFFGSALTWTGLPILAADTSGNPYASGLLFLMATVSTILFSFFGGVLSDRVSRKKLHYSASIVSILSMVPLYLIELPVYAYGLLFFVASAAGTIQTSAIGPWMSDVISDMKGDTSQLLAKRRSFSLAGKLAGMALGPVVYGYLGRSGVAIDVLTSLIELGILAYVPFIAGRGSKSLDHRKLLPTISEAKRYGRLIALQSSTSVLSFPVMSVAIIGLKSVFDSGAEYVSAFWLIASLSGLATNLVIAKGYLREFSSTARLLVATLCFCTGLILMWGSQSPAFLLVSYLFIALSNPVINNFIDTTLVVSTVKENRGRVYGYCDSVAQIGVLLALAAVQLSGAFGGPLVMFLVFVPLAIIRLLVIGAHIRGSSRTVWGEPCGNEQG